MRTTRKQRLLWDAGLWLPAKPSIIRPRSRGLLPGFCVPLISGEAGNPNAFGTLLFIGHVGNGGGGDKEDTEILDLTGLNGTALAPLGDPFEVFEGDLIIAVASEQDNHASAVTDNLGNTYTASNAGSSSGNAFGRMFYSIVTFAGIVTALTFDTTTTDTSPFSLICAAFAGSFSAIDKNIANNTDATSPHVAPSSGTLTQAVEIVIGWAAIDPSSGPDVLFNAVTVGTEAYVDDAGGGMRAAIAYQVTAATTSVAITWTSVNTPTAVVLGTSTFMQG